MIKSHFKKYLGDDLGVHQMHAFAAAI